MIMRVDMAMQVPLSHSVEVRRIRRRSALVRRALSDANVGADVIIIGAGLAGLAAATHLQKKGIEYVMLEASDDVGGRVRTDAFEGYLLDRGFQIFISAYPEAMSALDYDALHLQNFFAGASVWFDGEFHRVADPFRHPIEALMSLWNPIGTVLDKMLVGVTRFQAASRSFDEILSADEVSIREKLQMQGFSASMVDRFFKPFLGGIFFDEELNTTSRLLEFVLKCLASGSNTLPSKGIGQIPLQLAANLPKQSLILNTKVDKISNEEGLWNVKLNDDRLLTAKKGIILAVEAPEASRLLNNSNISPHDLPESKPARSTVCIYFSANQAPVNDPILFLNGSGKGIINNMFFPSNVCPSYAPPGKALVSVSLIGSHSKTSDTDLQAIVKDELRNWFGEAVVDWRHLRTYRIKFAQPDQCPPTNLGKKSKLCQGLYICGDHRNSATFDGALVSGRMAAQAFMCSN